MCMGNGRLADLIIIVDDDEAVRRSLTLLLASYDCEVVSFASARALLAAPLCWDHRFCLVVDQDMPDMSGLDLLAILRAAGRTQPAVLITGLVDGRGRIETAAADLPGTIFLHKPIDADTLIGCVRLSLHGPAED